MAESEIHDRKRLLELTFEPNWADLDPDNRRYLIVDPGELASSELRLVSAWMQAQPIPIVSVGTTNAPVDVLLGYATGAREANEAPLGPVVAAIDRNPQAAAALVQVLRAGATLDVVDGLALESFAYATLQGGVEFGAWVEENRVRHPSRGDQGPLDVVALERSGDCLEITLDSPTTRNALSVAMRDGLTDAFKMVAMDASITRVEVSGRGPCFSAGGDLSEFGSVADVASAHAIRQLRMPARYLAGNAERYHFHLHGACIGAGIELPAFAGRITAAADAFFQLPEVGFGLIPGAGGCVSIPRRIGRERTAYLALTGERLSAERALDWGLIDAIVE